MKTFGWITLLVIFIVSKHVSTFELHRSRHLLRRPFQRCSFSLRSSIANNLVRDASRKLQDRFWQIDQHTKSKMDLLLRLFESERIDASAFHGVDGS